MRPLIHIEYEAGGRIRQAWTYDASGIFDDRRNSNVASLARFTKGQLPVRAGTIRTTPTARS